VLHRPAGSADGAGVCTARLVYTALVTPPELSALRAAIDEIDHQILDLLHKRLELVLRVGELKRERGQRVYDPDRERDVLERLTGARKAPLKAETVRRVFERIIDESRSHEQHHISEPPGKD